MAQAQSHVRRISLVEEAVQELLSRGTLEVVRLVDVHSEAECREDMVQSCPKNIKDTTRREEKGLFGENVIGGWAVDDRIAKRGQELPIQIVEFRVLEIHFRTALEVLSDDLDRAFERHQLRDWGIGQGSPEAFQATGKAAQAKSYAGGDFEVGVVFEDASEYGG